MPKVNRPIVLVIIFAVAVYVVVTLTQPQPPAAKSRARTSSASVAVVSADGVTDADLSAHFPRYAGHNRDPFVAQVSVARQKKDEWTLTGINSINGARAALVENSTTGESVFLSAGDRWNGLRVLAIYPDAVKFQNAFGQITRLEFVEEETAGPAPAIPSLPAITPLPPMPTQASR